MILCKIALFIYYILSLWLIKKAKNIRGVTEVGFFKYHISFDNDFGKYLELIE